MVIPAHEDFGTRSKRNDVEEKLCFEKFLRVTEDSHEDNLLEDSFDFDPDNLPNFISEEDRIFNSKARFSFGEFGLLTVQSFADGHVRILSVSFSGNLKPMKAKNPYFNSSSIRINIHWRTIQPPFSERFSK